MCYFADTTIDKEFSFKSIAEIEEKLGVDCFRAAATLQY